MSKRLRKSNSLFTLEIPFVVFDFDGCKRDTSIKDRWVQKEHIQDTKGKSLNILFHYSFLLVSAF